MVLDASAALRSLESDPVAYRLRSRFGVVECHAPHLFDAEIGQSLRRFVLAGRLEADAARVALRALSGVVARRYPHAGPLSDRAWTLRDNVSFYDGLYVALAAELDLPLVTHDARLARAPGLPCEIELVE